MYPIVSGEPGPLARGAWFDVVGVEGLPLVMVDSLVFLGNWSSKVSGIRCFSGVVSILNGWSQGSSAVVVGEEKTRLAVEAARRALVDRGPR